MTKCSGCKKMAENSFKKGMNFQIFYQLQHLLPKSTRPLLLDRFRDSSRLFEATFVDDLIEIQSNSIIKSLRPAIFVRFNRSSL
jgi:hypothetical protein